MKPLLRAEYTSELNVKSHISSDNWVHKDRTVQRFQLEIVTRYTKSLKCVPAAG